MSAAASCLLPSQELKSRLQYADCRLFTHAWLDACLHGSHRSLNPLASLTGQLGNVAWQVYILYSGFSFMPMLLAWKHCLVLQQTHHPTTTPGSPLASILPFLVQDAATGQLQQNEMKRAVQLRKTLADLGPAFIKVGQALSARPDLLPQTYLEVCTFATSVLPFLL